MASDTTGPAPAVTDDLRERIVQSLAATWGRSFGVGLDVAIPRAADDLIVQVIRPWLAGRTVVPYDDYVRLIQYRRDTLGLICPQGHHTRFVDVLGDPNSDGYVCAHCAVRAERSSESSGDSAKESLAARIARFGSSGHIKIGSPEGAQIVEDSRPRCPAEGPTDLHDGPHVCVRHAGHSEPPEDEHLCGCGADWSGESSGDGGQDG